MFLAVQLSLEAGIEPSDCMFTRPCPATLLVMTPKTLTDVLGSPPYRLRPYGRKRRAQVACMCEQSVETVGSSVACSSTNCIATPLQALCRLARCESLKPLVRSAGQVLRKA